MVIVAAVLVLVVALAASQLLKGGEPGQQEEGPRTVTVTDALGRTVEVALPVEKVIFTGKASAMTLSAAYMFENARAAVYGLSPSYGEAALYSAINEGNEDVYLEDGEDLSVEEIAALEPDVVFLKSYLQSDLGDPLEELGVTVVYLDLEELDAYVRDMRVLGDIFEEPETAEEIVEYYTSKYGALDEATSAIPDDERPRTLFLYYSNKGGTVSFKCPGASWMQTHMIDVAGGYPLTEELEGTGWNTVSFEQIAQWDPEIVFIVTYGDDPSPVEVRQMLAEDPLWQTVDAVAERRLYAIPDDCFGYPTIGSWDTPGSRWILGVEWMADKIGVSGLDIDVEAEARYFYEEFYGLDASQVDAIISDMGGDPWDGP